MSLIAKHSHVLIWAGIRFAFVALLIGELPAAVHAQENLPLSVPPGGWCAALTTKVPTCWTLAEPPHQTKDTLLMEFVREGDAIASWRELITMQQFRRNKNSPSPREAYDSMKARRTERCPGVTQWQVVEENEAGLTYESHTTGPCEAHPPETELARFIYAKRTWYRVAYVTRSDLAPEARQEWMGWLRGLELAR
jgi:hypothetical protein